METLNYKCPNCSAGLTFDSKTQKMRCKYCGSSWTVDELEESQEQADTFKEDTSGNHWEGFSPEDFAGGEKKDVAEWNCPSCGAQLITDKTAAACVCPYCDTPMVMPEQFTDVYRPDYVIPFKKDKKEAVAALKKHYLKKPLLPKAFKDQNHLEEIKAVYVPFWLFDVKAAGRFRYECTRERFWDDAEYDYVETSHYMVIRNGRMEFERIPADGSKKIDDTMMESIEPYDYADLKPFEMRYLSGYMADKYDEEPDDLTDRVYERMRESVRDSMSATVLGYTTVFPQREDVHVTEKGKVKYGLLPVWFLNTRWNGKFYSFAMNGQTGKFIGDLPVGKDLVVHYWFAHHIPLTLVMTAVLLILRLTGVI